MYRDPLPPTNISFNDCHFGTECFQRVTKVKSRMVLRILKLGYNVLLSDVDVYWFMNPLPFIYTFGSGVLVAQSDEYKKTGFHSHPRCSFLSTQRILKTSICSKLSNYFPHFMA